MTAILLSNFVWEGLSTEMNEVDAKDGQFYKQLDTGESYIHRDGVWQFINLGLSYIKATKSGKITTDDDGVFDVVFETPFINDLYTVALCIENGGVTPYIAGFSDIATTGFTIHTKDSRSGQPVGNVVVSWLATRNYNP